MVSSMLPSRPILITGAIIACVIAATLSGILKRDASNEAHPASGIYRSNETRVESVLCKALAEAFPGCIFAQSKHQHQHVYRDFVGTFWSVNAGETTPDCIARPSNVQEVSAIVKHLKHAYEMDAEVKFAVRSGGHSPEAGFSSISDGVVIDMSSFKDIVISPDETTTTVGVGARWIDVYTKLGTRGLTIVGGRDSNVGVGGLVLGGGISFFSPRFGMVCDNIDKYEIVVANGSIIEATAQEHSDLWRALKGGTGNFGIVTKVTAKTFASGDIWAGYAFWPNWQADKVLTAFNDFNKPESFDAYAGGPILALSYVQSVGLRLVACSLSYTRPRAWPTVFDGFRKIWRAWSTVKVQSLLDTAHELRSQAPSGRRQFQVTTTIKNDLQTFREFSKIYTEKLKQVTGIRDSIWSLVFQPLSAAVTRKGSPNVLGLETRHINDTLIIVLISLSYPDARDDELARRVARDIIATGEQYAKTVGTWDPYIYLNYAASGQDVYSGYGTPNKDFLAATSRLYDPDGFFQHSRQGGFKLPPM